MLLNSRFLPLMASKQIFEKKHRCAVVVRPVVSVALVVLLLAGYVPPAMAGSLALEVFSLTGKGVAAIVHLAGDPWYLRVPQSLNSLAWLSWPKASRLGTFQSGSNRGMPATPANPRGVKPPQPPSKFERESKVASIRINPKGDLTLHSREPIVFSASPIDGQGNSIHGLEAVWESSDKQIVFVTNNGQATAGKPGRAVLTVKAGQATEKVQITVVEGTKERFGGKKSGNSKRVHSRKSGNRFVSDIHPALASLHERDQKLGERSGPASLARMRPVRASLARITPLRDPNDDPLPDDETPSLYSPANGVGSPPGRKTPGGLTPAVATNGTETPGSENFTFALPVTSLPGRGIDASLSLVYNSRTFNKSTDIFDGTTWMTYDVDSGWPAAGFRLGYGQIEDQGTFGFTLTDADGTRHALALTSAYNYDTTDGTFMHFVGGRGWGSLYYADGTRADYGAAGSGVRSYPTKIVDRNGNYILISYVGGVGPKISSIQDTLERHVSFYYASNGDLVTITSPGLTGQAERQVIRFYYQDITIDQSGLFQSSINVNAPATAHVIKYLYLPSNTESGDAHLGYRYDYSAYGMIYQVAQFRGMTADSSALDQTGSISAEGIQAALTTYNYPTTPSDLADAPSYTRRTDDWAGRTTGMPATGEAPYYTFAVDQATGVSTVTAPDGTVTETHSIVAPGQWNDGLLSQTIVKQGANGPTLARTDTSWELDANGRNARPQQLQMTNDAGQTTTTVLTYSSYNNVVVASTRGFDGGEVRRVEIDYQTNAAWTNRRLLHLPASARVYAGGSTTPASRNDYAYDTTGTNLTPRNDIIMHEAAFDPFAPTEEICNWECNSVDEFGNCNWEWVCQPYSPYDPATDKRGNVTSITTYAEAASGGGAITHATTYDIAGNVITAQVDCCQQKSFSYSSSYFYAYPTSVTNGAGPTLTTSVGYDFNTGLAATTTDENGQQNSAFYNSDSLRPEHIDFPDGGAVSYHYNDNLISDAAGRQHFYAFTSTKLDSSRIIDSYRFFDGRGAVTQTFDNYTAVNGWSTQDIEYDAMGRAYRTGNPYYCGGYGAVGINPTGLWTARSFDNLGRVTRVDMPSGDAQSPTAAYAASEYAGVFTTVTDQAGKQRRQKTDELGHVVRLDEPDDNGNLGSTDTPNQSTAYEYDTLDNLIHIAQGSQHRYFKYDSLSRLTYERQVEQDAPYTTTDPVAGNNQWSRKIIYNSQSLVQEAYEARQVRTQFIYDGLNRVKEIHYFKPDGSVDQNTPAAFYYYGAEALPSGAPAFDRGYSTGRLVAMTYGSSTATTGNYFGYEQMGRVVTHRQVTGATTYALSYGYNLGGLLTSESYPTGRALSYAYDEGARLSQLSEGASIYAGGFSYEPHGGLNSETFGNGAVHSMAYNRALQASEIKLKQSGNGAELQRYNYLYGRVNQGDGSVDTTKNNGQIGRVDGFINGAKQWDQRFSYDSLARLSTAAEYRGDNVQQTWQTHYDYDRYGNRFQFQNNSNVGYVPVQTGDISATNNRFISTGATPTSYDPAGNILSDAKFRGMNYSYDANGRQTFAERDDHTNQQTSVYDCGGQRVQTTANSTTRTMVYDIFGQTVVEYSNGSLERENIYRGGQLLAVSEPLITAPAAPSELVAVPSSGGASITLSWSAAAGATNYRVSRAAGKDGPYQLVGATSSTGFTDSGVRGGTAYLYRVCAADSQNNCISGYSNIAMSATVTFPTDPAITTFGEDPANATSVKAAHITELRTAVNAVRHLAAMSDATWTHPTLTSGVSVIGADDVRDLRSKLDEALTALRIQTSAYTDQTLAGAPNGTLIKGAHITELRQRATRGVSPCYKTITQFVADFYQGALHRQPSSSESSSWTATLTQAQAQGQAQLTAAAQSLGNALFTSAEYGSLNTSNAQFITDLYAGYLQRTPDTSGYNFWLGVLNGPPPDTRTHLILAFAVSTEFQDNVSALCWAAGTSGGLRYVLSDLQGSARAVMNSTGVGSSTIIARHDYLPFGEEITAGTGLRTTGQGYGALDTNRWKYGLLERDASSGLDHTSWRKYESLSGRWTSPDPYRGSMAIANPQSFNRYSYTQNDPVNLVDPTGLSFCVEWVTYENSAKEMKIILHRECFFEDGGGWGFMPIGGGPSGGGPGGGGPSSGPQNPASPPPRPADRRHMLDDCHFLAATADELAAKTWTDWRFVGALKQRFVPPSNQDSPAMREFRADGFKGRFNDDESSYNQVRHFVGAFSNAYYGGVAASLANISYSQAVVEGVNQALKREGPTEYSDKRLSAATVPEAVALAYEFRNRKNIGDFIRKNICGTGW